MASYVFAVSSNAQVEARKVRQAFPSWELLLDSHLRQSLLNWSKRWNLNVSWCRDHALTVLHRWFYHKGLQESFLHPYDPIPSPFAYPPKAQVFRWNELGERRLGKPNNWLTRVWASTSEKGLHDEFGNERLKHHWDPSLTISRDMLKWCVFSRSEQSGDEFSAGEPPSFTFQKFNHEG
jgi:hypothetical protein